MNRTRTSITRVAETRATRLPQKVALFVKSHFCGAIVNEKHVMQVDIAVQWGGKHMFQQAPRTSVSKQNYREFV